MKALKQTGTIDSYVQEFRALASRSHITDVNVLNDYFTLGLNPGLVVKMFSSLKLPDTMDEWYQLAANLELQYQQAKLITGGGKGGGGRFNKSRNTGNPQNQGNSGSTTRLRKLTDKERDQLAKEGKCFRCRETGHIAVNCPKNSGTRQIRATEAISDSASTSDAGTIVAEESKTQNTIDQVKALIAKLSTEEREEFFSVAETEGF